MSFIVSVEVFISVTVLVVSVLAQAEIASAAAAIMLPLMMKLYVGLLGEGGAPLSPRIDSEIENHLSFMEGAIKGRDLMSYMKLLPGVVDTTMHANAPDEFLKGLSPMGMISDVEDIVDAIVYLTEARHVTGEVLHVDAGAHNGKW